MKDQREPGPDPVIRSGPSERDYLLKRAVDHQRLAEKADEAGSRTIHLRLQQLYEEQAVLLAMVFAD
ncbi:MULTISPECIES: hypothetical protein [unclassified Sphingomonas]|uniref:hypothetical protein n=1 Tax=unclassified Sphingomonas TaxID=196159 RepID=UPI001F574BD6|nr:MULTISPECIES: hypothetical protein [unclassified Sphingomonas]